MKTRLLGILVLVAAAALATPVRAAVAPAGTQVQAWDALRARLDPVAAIRWGDETGTPATILLKEPAPLAPGLVPPSKPDAAKSVADAFFRDQAALFRIRPGIDAPLFDVDRFDRGEHHLSYRQLYRGLRVATSGYRVTVGADGSPEVVSGRWYPGIEIGVTPTIDAGAASASALKSLGLSSNRSPSAPELIVLPAGGTLRLAYEVSVRSPNSIPDWKVYVDASDGTVLRKVSMLANESAPSAHKMPAGGSPPGAAAAPTASSAKAPQVLPGPRNNSPNAIIVDDGGGGGGGGGSGGGCGSPNGNVFATTPCDVPFTTNVYLPHLTSYMSPQGSWVSTQPYPYSGQQAQPASDPNNCGQFQYTPPDFRSQYDLTGFDDVNLYYQIDRAFNDYFQARFGFYSSYTPYQAFTHFPDPDTNNPNWGNGAYNFDDRTFYFGHGNFSYSGSNTPSYDLAKNRWAIFHEVTHAVLHVLGIQGGDLVFETAAIQEGLADYFPSSFFSSANFGTCTMTGTCESSAARPVNTPPATFNYQNYLNSTLSYTYCDGSFSYSWQNPHVLGMVLSGTMWDIRSAFPSSPVDSWVYNAANYCSSYPDFYEFRDMVYIAAGPSYRTQLQCIFAARGLDVMPTVPPAPTTVIASDGLCGVTVSWSAVASAAGYRVYQSGLKISGDLPATQTSYNVPSPPLAGTNYTVTAFHCGGEGSGRSDTGYPIPIPAIPTGLTATDATVNCGVALSWSAVTYASTYQVFRAGQLVQTVNAPATSWTDTDAPQGYSMYRVLAADCTGASAQCPGVNGRPAPVLAAPTVSASDGTSPTTVTVTWSAVANAAGYHVYRANNPTPIADLPSTTLSYDDNQAPDGATLYGVAGYVCTGKKDGPRGTDFGSKAMTVTIVGPTSTGSDVVSLWQVSVTGGTTPYTYTWYKYRDCPGGPIDPGPALSAQEVTCWAWIIQQLYTGNSIGASDHVDFRLKCVVTDEEGQTAFAQRNVDVAGSVGQPQAPVSFVTASDGTQAGVRIDWGPSDGAEGFRVYRAGTLIATLGQTARTTTDASAPAAVTSYCVVAYSGANASSSVCDTGYPLTPPPTASISGPSQLNINQVGTFTANVTGGIAPLTYQWYKAWLCNNGPTPASAQSASGGPIIEVPPCNQDEPFGDNTPTVTTSNSIDFRISCRVTDAAGRSYLASKVVDVLGSLAASKTAEGARLEAALPARTELLGVIPNPAKGDAEIGFALAKPSHVTLDVLDITGRQVSRLENGWRSAGVHRISWQTQSLQPGLYFFRMKAAEFSQIKRVSIIR